VVEVAVVVASTAGAGGRDSPDSSAAGTVQMQGQSKAIQCRAEQDRERQDRARQGKARQGQTRQWRRNGGSLANNRGKESV
jgi:hypothetical protein